MFYVKKIESFNLFMPSSRIIPKAAAATLECQKVNRQYLASTDAGLSFPKPGITGSYVCAHAPDYYGEPTLSWDAARWLELFTDMKKHGLDTVILQASIWHELGECYYRSHRFGGEYRQFNVVMPMLEGATEAGLKVFLGGYGSVVGWLESQSDAAIEREIQRQTDCMTELLEYGKMFSGIYFSPETAFSGYRDATKEKMLNKLYREYFSRLKEIAPGKCIAMSPASSFFADKEQDFLDFWLNVLDNVPLDILMPQDSIGSGGCSLGNQPEQWQRWRGVTAPLRLHLWAHVELFERRCFDSMVQFDAADPQRVAAQLRNLMPFVEKCICFEYPYFANNAKGGKELKEKIF